jgi:dTDP-4-amino-4,6-dideoxygalactose transaminase
MKYDAFFSKYDFFKIPLDNKDYYNSYHLYPLRIDFKKLKKTKTQLMNYFFKNKVRLQVHYIPTYRMKIFKNWDKKNFPICEEVYNNIVSIPLFDNLKNEQVDKVITLFKKFFDLK